MVEKTCIQQALACPYHLIYTFLSSVQPAPGNHNWIEILGVVLVIISSTVPSVVKTQGKSKSETKAHSVSKVIQDLTEFIIYCFRYCLYKVLLVHYEWSTEYNTVI